MDKNNIGKVYIAGAGPGDPGLLTVKCHKLITKSSDIIIYDRLVSDEILQLIPSKIEKIYVGKVCRKHEVSQEEINNLLVQHAKLGKVVVRLKGGDPLIFGRLGEEMDFLIKNQVDFEIIPGITSASGCASIAGIPLTQRGIANSIRFITGHQEKDKKIDLNWKNLADPKTTLVVYMGFASLKVISHNLISAGLKYETPVAAIQEGTTPRETIKFSTLGRIYDAIIEANMKSPILIIIGNTVALSQHFVA